MNKLKPGFYSNIGKGMFFEVLDCEFLENAAAINVRCKTYFFNEMSKQNYENIKPNYEFKKEYYFKLSISSLSTLTSITEEYYKEKANKLLIAHIKEDVHNYKEKLKTNDAFTLDPHFMRLSEVVGSGMSRILLVELNNE